MKIEREKRQEKAGEFWRYKGNLGREIRTKSISLTRIMIFLKYVLAYPKKGDEKE